MEDERILLGVDVGGTFTDAVALVAGRAYAAKALSTADGASGVLAAVRAALTQADGTDDGEARVARFAHGTTVATNALLERRGARVAALLTDACRDLLELGRQQRPRLFDLEAHPVRPPASSVVGVRERTFPDGPREQLTAAEVRRVVEEVAASGAEAVAICLLHSWAHPGHEEELAAALRKALPDVHVVASSELSRELREYERASTTVLDAYLTPVLAPYLRRLGREAREAGLPEPLVMASDGGLDELEAVAAHAARAVLSGPAGGLVAAGELAAALGAGGIVCMDVGGTSCDVAALGGARIERAATREIDGLPLQLHAADIHTIGAGGSSIAWLDDGGALRVGPASAGSRPGPACYGLGGEQPTLTDAHAVLGSMRPDLLQEWGVQLDLDAARRALERLDPDPVAAASAVVQVAVTGMAEAARVVSVARGLEPRDLALFAFGGAGGLHACLVAQELGCDRVVVPALGGVLSALGLAIADVRRSRTRSVRVEPRAAAAATALEDLYSWAAAELATLTAAVRRHGPVDLELSCDLRYRGQSHAIEVVLAVESAEAGTVAVVVDEAAGRFEAEHADRYGFALEQPVELVTLRPAAIARAHAQSGAPAGLDATPRRTATLADGSDVLLVELASGVLVVHPGWRIVEERCGCLVLEREEVVRG